MRDWTGEEGELAWWHLSCVRACWKILVKFNDSEAVS